LSLNAEQQRPVVARINGEPVYAAEVDAELRLAFGERRVEEGQRSQLLKAALEQVIDRRLVLANLTKTGQAASAQDVDVALAQFEKDLKAQGLTMEEHCQKVGLTVEDVHRSLAWKLSWQRYLERYVTPENLEKFFERQRREFDGTELRVAQILFKLPMEVDEAAKSDAKKRAEQVRQEIAAGKTTFADAAKRHSQAPSSQEGGDIGWIERHRPMPEDFSRAAYGLKVGEVSEPITSPFGVHLITVLEEKRGNKTWQDVESELRPAVALYLFRWIADKERATAKVEYESQ
jgi:peptidyl-prolyl cis-trans isomerase C